MKKVCALLLALILVLSLAACGGSEEKEDTSTEAADAVEATENPYSKEAMLALANDPNTQVTEYKDIASVLSTNSAKAKMEYCDKTLVVQNGAVGYIESDYIEMNFAPFFFSANDGASGILVYLPVEDIAELEDGQRINIVGHFDAENPNKIDKAYLTKDRYEFTGTFEHQDGSPYYSFTDNNGDKYYNIEKSEFEKIPGFNTDDEFSFSAKVLDGYTINNKRFESSRLIDIKPAG